MPAATKTKTLDIAAVVRSRCSDIETLEERGSDSLDFHRVAVWNLRAMISDVAPKLSDRQALAIVRTHASDITTLAARNSDAADIHELAVWTLKAILRNAASFQTPA